MKSSFIAVSLGLGAVLFCGARAHADTIYASLVSGSIMKFDSSGGNGTVFASGLNMPRGLAFDRSANLYAAIQGNDTIMKFHPNGNGSVFVSGVNGWCLAFDSSGNLYVPNNNTIEKFSRTGTDLGVFADLGLNSPLGLAFDSIGNLYVANQGNDTIEKFSPAGTDLGAFANLAEDTPECLAFDSSGNLYVSTETSTIEKFSPTGTDLGAFGNLVLSAPRGLAFDSNGYLYVANHGNGTIDKFDPSGNGSVFESDLASVWGIAIVPEPATWALMALGAGVLLGRRGLHRRSS